MGTVIGCTPAVTTIRGPCLSNQALRYWIAEEKLNDFKGWVGECGNAFLNMVTTSYNNLALEFPVAEKMGCRYRVRECTIDRIGFHQAPDVIDTICFRIVMTGVMREKKKKRRRKSETLP